MRFWPHRFHRRAKRRGAAGGFDHHIRAAAGGFLSDGCGHVLPLRIYSAGCALAGAAKIIAVDIDEGKLALARHMGVAVPAEMPFDRACLIGCGVMTGVGAALNVAHVLGVDWWPGTKRH